MEDLRKVEISEAVNIILLDVVRDTVKEAYVKSLAKAVRESDKDEYGRSLFGSDSVVGASLLSRVYGAQVIGKVADSDLSLKRKVYVPLGFQIFPVVKTTLFYEVLGKALQDRF